MSHRTRRAGVKRRGAAAAGRGESATDERGYAHMTSCVRVASAPTSRPEMSRPFRPVPLLLAAGLLGVPAALAAVVAIPHVTDVHIDPFYVRNAIADGCYCETHASCARMPASCVVTNDPGKAAGAFGMSEADCATPPALWDSALGFLEGLNSAAPFTVFTGDFGEAGLSAACSPSAAARS